MYMGYRVGALFYEWYTKSMDELDSRMNTRVSIL